MGLEGPKSLLTFFFPRLVLLIAVIGAGVGASPASKSSSGGGGSIYDHLRQYGLPIGLLPKGITEYALNTTSGEFRVFLAAPCHAKFENQVRYDFNVSGTLTFGRIADLSGVSAQELFLWFPVKGIRVDVPSSGLIYFDVGVVDKQFSLSLFESPPDCTALDPSDPSSSSSNSPSVSASSSSSKLKLKLKLKVDFDSRSGYEFNSVSSIKMNVIVSTSFGAGNLRSDCSCWIVIISLWLVLHSEKLIFLAFTFRMNNFYALSYL